MGFVRFVGAHRHRHSGAEIGLFQIAYAIMRDTNTGGAIEHAIRQELNWFRNNLPVPTRFNRSRSKGYYRRGTKGISWFKDSAAECLARMHVLRQIAETHGQPITVVTEDRVGYIVYEDDVQVVAEPFADTRTG
jgi:hypothetical protein